MLASEAEEGGLQVFLGLSASNVRITMAHLIGKKNWGRNGSWEEELSCVCTWGDGMIADSGQQYPTGD